MIKYFTYGLAILPSIIAPEALQPSVAPSPLATKLQKAITSIKPSEKDAAKIALAISQCAQSKNIPWKELLAVALVESNLNPKTIRKVSGRNVDYGLFQINIRTLKHYKLDKSKMTDIQYNTTAACTVINDIRKVRKNWHGYYNVGPYSKNDQKRMNYEKKLKSKLKTINLALAKR